MSKKRKEPVNMFKVLNDSQSYAIQRLKTTAFEGATEVTYPIIIRELALAYQNGYARGREDA